MAERRMFTKKVTDDDNFMSLSSSAQALYLHLSMSADDDGFCNQVSASMFKAHASVQDLQALLEKRYIYQFENGVIVIKHWRMANALRKDRYTPTAFQEELAQLDLKENGSYTWLPNGCQMVAKRLPQDRLGKDRLDKDRKETKHKYGEYKHVLLSDQDMEKLKAEYQDVVIDKAIKILDEYIETSGKKYKNHYLVLKKWTLERAIEEVRKGNNGKSESGTRADVESDEDLQRRYEQVMRQLEEDGEDEWA